ncbi:hypothetical protein [Sabulibacter ruber]|uniref:hypothetical protein n=1 Tax=Sabulibacter ruber TaxID=2811901 RepID=UPI001A95DECF|nr:hypothetical protein [Sabulibacter ruber]
MQKLRSIHSALLNLTEELEEEEARFNEVTTKVVESAQVSVAGHFATCSSQSGVPMKPHIKIDVQDNSFLVECFILASEVFGKKNIVLSTVPSLQFFLSAAQDQAQLLLLRNIYQEFKQLKGKAKTAPGLEDYSDLTEFKTFLFLFNNAISS